MCGMFERLVYIHLDAQANHHHTGECIPLCKMFLQLNFIYSQCNVLNGPLAFFRCVDNVSFSLKQHRQQKLSCLLRDGFGGSGRV